MAGRAALRSRLSRHQRDTVAQFESDRHAILINPAAGYVCVLSVSRYTFYSFIDIRNIDCVYLRALEISEIFNVISLSLSKNCSFQPQKRNGRPRCLSLLFWNEDHAFHKAFAIYIYVHLYVLQHNHPSKSIIVQYSPLRKWRIWLKSHRCVIRSQDERTITRVVKNHK